MKILVSGLLNVETTCAVRGFPIEYYPIDYPFFGVNSNVSGVGYNLAKALTTLGDNVDVVSFIGQDSEGDRVVKALGDNGISTDGISRSLKKTPCSVVLYDPDGKRQIYCDLKDIQDQLIDPEATASRLDGCAVSAVCNINFNRSFIKKARQLGALTATDVHVLSSIDDDYNRDFMENADILFLSNEKLPYDAKETAQRLWDKYRNRMIVIGMGGKGALLLDSESGTLCTLDVFPCEKIVNTVGAGDALFSAFLHFTAKGDKPVEALKKAEIFASVKIGYNGASVGFIDEGSVEKLYAENEIAVNIL